MEAEHQHFAVQGVEPEQCPGDPLAVFEVGDAVKGSGLAVLGLEAHGTIVVMVALKELIEAAGGALAALVDDQVARDGEQPGLKPRLPVELAAAHEYAHPDLLKKIFGHLSMSCEIKKIAQQAVLVADDQLVEQPGILTLEPLCNSQIFPARQLISGGGRTKSGKCGSKAHHTD